MNMDASSVDSERLDQICKEVRLTRKEVIESYNINFVDVDLGILDKLAEIPTKEENING